MSRLVCPPGAIETGIAWSQHELKEIAKRSESGMNTAPDSGQRIRRQQHHEAVDVVFEINLVDGAEAERIGLLQAAVIRDLVLLHHRNVGSAPPHTSAT
ncbi:hypothetical protein [Lentzea sp. NPDC004782]|uniref:hypothetical protein n=1 Tax=Lentzea sp. NPDC004782 TaxID=3154458 RepID=UPI0033AB13FD